MTVDLVCPNMSIISELYYCFIRENICSYSEKAVTSWFFLLSGLNAQMYGRQTVTVCFPLDAASIEISEDRVQCDGDD